MTVVSTPKYSVCPIDECMFANSMQHCCKFAFVDGIPMRELVYRVQPLPVALKALIWDFGTLTSTENELQPGTFVGTEHMYIKKMVDNFVS